MCDSKPLSGWLMLPILSSREVKMARVSLDDAIHYQSILIAGDTDPIPKVSTLGIQTLRKRKINITMWVKQECTQIFPLWNRSIWTVSVTKNNSSSKEGLKVLMKCRRPYSFIFTRPLFRVFVSWHGEISNLQSAHISIPARSFRLHEVLNAVLVNNNNS